MTRLEIERAKDTLPKGWDAWKNATPEQKMLERELAWREYVNSCLAYGQFGDVIQDCKLSPKLYRWGTATTYHIGEELSIPRAIQIALEQKADFAKAKVLYNVYTDCEGCSYNSVIWHDEQEN